MPYIPQDVIEGVFYLYRDREDALAGRSPGGTGFVVRHDGTYWQPNKTSHFYGVTNWHVACDGGFSTIRLNTKDGGTDIIEFGPEDWHFLPGSYDVAAVPLRLDSTIHAVSSISTRLFQMPPDRMAGRVGVGDDVFMIGLFIDHDGVSRNIPSARFGNISMLPNPRATIEQPTRYNGESFVVDMHSRSGFSGSPVYIYRTFGSDLTSGHFGHDVEVSNIREWSGSYKGRVRLESSYFKLLGIHWGQFPERWELHDKGKLLESRRDLIVKGGYVEGLSGMTCVIPAWNIFEVLDMPHLKDLRDSADADRVAGAAKPKPELAVTTEVAPATDNPSHKEDFTRLLSAASKAKPPA